MLFISISDPNFLDQLPPSPVELRLDLFPVIDGESIRNFIKTFPAPVLLTLRKKSEGGNFQGSERKREKLIKELLRLEPAFFDLESDMRPSFLQETLQNHPKTKFILSQHHFEKNIEIDSIYRKMQKHPAFHYKIAIQTSTNEAIKMLLYAKNEPKLSIICLGEQGAFARILNSIFGKLSYACIDLEKKTGEGQLTFSELMNIYHISSLHERSEIYGLIGDPVKNSPGHLYHNAQFQKKAIPGVYVKMQLLQEELLEFIPLAKAIGIKGLSVTIPHKEKILPFIDEFSPTSKEIGAINTLLFKDKKIMGTNTDGHGALDALEKIALVQGKKIVLVGAGGAARGIAFEAKARGAEVLIVNRTFERAKKLGEEIGCKALIDIPDSYDILINCSPLPMPIDPKKIVAKTIAMDIVYFPKITPFLEEALKKGCQVVYGEEMFLHQAARQITFWTGK